jgi:hypothetical protein
MVARSKFFDLLINYAPHAEGIAELLAALYVMDHKLDQTQTDLRIRSLDIYLNFATNKPEQHVALAPYSSSIAFALASLHTLNSDKQYQPLFLEQEQLECILNNPSKAATLTKAIGILEIAGLSFGESGKSNLNHLIICLTSIDQIVEKVKNIEKLEHNLTQGVFDDIIAECYQTTFKEAGLNLGPASTITINYLFDSKVADSWPKSHNEKISSLLEKINCPTSLEQKPQFKKFSTIEQIHLYQLLKELEKTQVFIQSDEKKATTDRPSNQEILDQIITKKPYLEHIRDVVSEFNKCNLLQNPQAPFLFGSILQSAVYCETSTPILQNLIRKGQQTPEIFQRILEQGVYAEKLHNLLKLLWDDNDYSFNHFITSSRSAKLNLERIIDNAPFAEKIRRVILLIDERNPNLFDKSHLQAQKNFNLLCDHAKSLDTVIEKIKAKSKSELRLSQTEFEEIVASAAPQTKETKATKLPDSRLLAITALQTSSPIYSQDYKPSSLASVEDGLLEKDEAGAADPCPSLIEL